MATVDNVAYTIGQGMTMGSDSVTGNSSGTAGKGQKFSVTYDSAGAKTLALPFDHAKITAIAIGCDQAITSISFTGTTGPYAVGAVPAGGSWQWALANSAEPFAASCTAIVVTLTAFPVGVTAATLKILIAESV